MLMLIYIVLYCDSDISTCQGRRKQRGSGKANQRGRLSKRALYARLLGGSGGMLPQENF